MSPKRVNVPAPSGRRFAPRNGHWPLVRFGRDTAKWTTLHKGSFVERLDQLTYRVRVIYHVDI